MEYRDLSVSATYQNFRQHDEQRPYDQPHKEERPDDHTPVHVRGVRGDDPPVDGVRPLPPPQFGHHAKAGNERKEDGEDAEIKYGPCRRELCIQGPRRVVV